MRSLIKNKTSTIFAGLVVNETVVYYFVSEPLPGSTRLIGSSSGPFLDNSGSSQRFNGLSTPGHRRQQYLITRRHRLRTATGLAMRQGRLQDLNIVRQRAAPVPRNESTTLQRCLPSAAGANLSSVSAYNASTVYQQTSAPTRVSAPQNAVSAAFNGQLSHRLNASIQNMCK